MLCYLHENLNLKIMPIIMNWKGLLGKSVLIELTEAPQKNLVLLSTQSL